MTCYLYAARAEAYNFHILEAYEKYHVIVPPEGLSYPLAGEGARAKRLAGFRARPLRRAPE
jgi:hypothetical protein